MTAADLDLSMFSETDLANIILQRSAVLGSGRRAQAPIAAWEAGDAGPLREAVARDGAAIARAAAEMIAAEFDELKPELKVLAPGRMADIGCGYAIFDLFAHRELGCDLLLIDIETSEARHFGFEAEAAGYTSLETARAFLTANGVPDKKIATWNPDREAAPEGAPVDLAVSFLSCGFHYPVDSYLPFFRHAIPDRGAVILDLRRRRAPESIAKLETIGSVRIIGEETKVVRVLMQKGPGR